MYVMEADRKRCSREASEVSPPYLHHLYLYIYRGGLPSLCCCIISPPSGVFDEIVAAGPVPVLVMALTLKVYEVKGLKPGISTEVVPAPCTGISPGESGPTTCTVYPVMTPFCFATGTGDQETSAVVDSLCLTLSPPGLPEGAGSKCVYMHIQ